jgi:hypothetical protein
MGDEPVDDWFREVGGDGKADADVAAALVAVFGGGAGSGGRYPDQGGGAVDQVGQLPPVEPPRFGDIARRSQTALRPEKNRVFVEPP